MPGLDANTKLLLHCDGADESVIIPDSSITNPKGNATVVGTAQLDTAQKKWGTASLLLDGNSDRLTYADSADWDIVGSNTDNWTIDFQAKFTDHVGAEYLMGQFEDGSNAWYFLHSHGNGLLFAAEAGGVIINTGYGGEITDTNWHHIALIKVADEYAIYLDGVQGNYTQDASTDTFASLLYIGSTSTGGWFDGHMDEIRIQKSNYFNATPVVGLTDTITVPTGAYSEAAALARAQAIII